VSVSVSVSVCVSVLRDVRRIRRHFVQRASSSSVSSNHGTSCMPTCSVQGALENNVAVSVAAQMDTRRRRRRAPQQQQHHHVLMEPGVLFLAR
jgi:hypothetical protein